MYVGVVKVSKGIGTCVGVLSASMLGWVPMHGHQSFKARPHHWVVVHVWGSKGCAHN